jgi:hypothetical protein
MTIAANLKHAGPALILLMFLSVGTVTAQGKPEVAARTTIKDVSALGAIGDGVTDDTEALQNALDALKAGETLLIPAGKTFRHTEVLTIRKAGVRLTGGGTLLATNEEKSALTIEADNVTLDGGLVLKAVGTTRRWSAPAQNKLNLVRHSGATVRNITVDGAAAAGIFAFGAVGYVIEDVTVQNTRADGIHNTHGAHNGVIRRPRITNVGDDGVAVVSYGRRTEELCRNITIESPRFYGNVWGRGLAVVGGEDITLRDIYVENSNAAGLYIATEGEPWNTQSTRRVRVLGGELKSSNQSTKVDHGAVLIYNARPDHVIEDISIEDLRIIGTNPKASRQVGILVGNSGGVQRIKLKNFRVSGGPSNLFVSDAPKERYSTRGWSFNGKDQPDRGAAVLAK